MRMYKSFSPRKALLALCMVTATKVKNIYSWFTLSDTEFRRMDINLCAFTIKLRSTLKVKSDLLGTNIRKIRTFGVYLMHVEFRVINNHI